MFDLPIIGLDGGLAGQSLLSWGRLFARANRVSLVRAVESERMSSAARLELSELARLFSPEAHVTIRVGNPGEVLLRTAIEAGADLILLSASEGWIIDLCIVS
jgi:nucleotide-binding universal stress UspA family protein